MQRPLLGAVKEESTLRKAMEKAQQQVAAANEAERAGFEARLAALQEQLNAAEEKNQRALSMAQQTRAGHVYVISNRLLRRRGVQIGMTRRLEPLDRIRELGDVSVPFEFDVHATIFSDDTPGQENQLHRHFCVSRSTRLTRARRSSVLSWQRYARSSKRSESNRLDHERSLPRVP